MKFTLESATVVERAQVAHDISRECRRLAATRDGGGIERRQRMINRTVVVVDVGDEIIRRTVVLLTEVEKFLEIDYELL